MLVQDRQGAVIEIERHSKLTVDMFRSEYLEKQIPVVIAGGAKSWPALKNWTTDYLTQTAGDFVLTVRSKSDYGELGSKRVGEKAEEINLRDLLRIIFESENVPDISYARQTNIMRHIPALALDVERPDYLPADKQSKDGLLWIGPAGTVAQMHWDSADNLFTQVKGQKEFILSPPMQSQFTYPNKFSLIDSLKFLPVDMASTIEDLLETEGITIEKFTDLLPPEIVSVVGGLLASFNNCHVNAEFPDYSQHPLFRCCDRYFATLDEGDMIFIPNMWRHYVKSTKNSISVNWFFEDPIISPRIHEKFDFLLRKSISEHLVLGPATVS